MQERKRGVTKVVSLVKKLVAKRLRLSFHLNLFYHISNVNSQRIKMRLYVRDKRKLRLK